MLVFSTSCIAYLPEVKGRRVLRKKDHVEVKIVVHFLFKLFNGGTLPVDGRLEAKKCSWRFFLPAKGGRHWDMLFNSRSRVVIRVVAELIYVIEHDIERVQKIR
jgi:hypothetical protein